MLVEVDLSSIVADIQHGGGEGDAGAGHDVAGMDDHHHQDGMDVGMYGRHGHHDVMVSPPTARSVVRGVTNICFCFPREPGRDARGRCPSHHISSCSSGRSF